jgi:hypothetical protein
MKKRFAVLQVTFCTNNKLNLSSTFRGLKELGIEVIKIQWKNENCLKLRVGIDPPGQIGKLLTTRESAVNSTVNKVQSYFKDKDALVVTTGKFTSPFRVGQESLIKR